MIAQLHPSTAGGRHSVPQHYCFLLVATTEPADLGHICAALSARLAKPLCRFHPRVWESCAGGKLR